MSAHPVLPDPAYNPCTEDILISGAPAALPSNWANHLRPVFQIDAADRLIVIGDDPFGSGLEQIGTPINELLSILEAQGAQISLPVAGMEALTSGAIGIELTGRLRDSVPALIFGNFVSPPGVDREDAIWKATRLATYGANIHALHDRIAIPNSVAHTVTQVKANFVKQALGALEDFTPRLWHYFSELEIGREIQQPDMCIVVDFFAYGRAEDQRILELALTKDYEIAGKLEFAAASALNTAREMNLISSVPRPICVEDSYLSVRLIPYANILPITVSYLGNNVTPGDLLDIYHEIGHYLFWAGNFNGSMFEQWSLSKLYAVWSAAQTLSRVKSAEDAQVKFEESFCDLVAIAIGGPLVAVSLLNTMLSIANTPRDKEYLNIQDRAEVIFAGLDALYDSWGSILRGIWSAQGVAPGEENAVKTLATDSDFVNFLKTLRDRANNGPAAALRTWAGEFTAAMSGAGASLEGFNLTDLARRWLDELDDDAALSGAVDAMCGDASTIDMGQKITEWGNKTYLPAPFSGWEADDGTHWYGVLQAGGWSTRGPRTEITD